LNKSTYTPEDTHLYDVAVNNILPRQEPMLELFNSEPLVKFVLGQVVVEVLASSLHVTLLKWLESSASWMLKTNSI
jgi:hypothetical protein